MKVMHALFEQFILVSPLLRVTPQAKLSADVDDEHYSCHMMFDKKVITSALQKDLFCHSRH
jgi:hypothetical protein